ncbi:hypothetical protein [Paenibacillus pini]|uniref:hypothetical protein n=1 Tax=Paenibacillus pini TaxID=669461 RepID=UPI000564AB17|nr:hypothetical protein [Paenibacillus pini]
MIEQLEIGIATVTGNGINFADIWYSSCLVIKHRWFEEAKIYGGWKTIVLYSRSDPATIIIFNNNFIDIGFKITNDPG